jgi:hypothetical protein
MQLVEVLTERVLCAAQDLPDRPRGDQQARRIVVDTLPRDVTLAPSNRRRIRLRNDGPASSSAAAAARIHKVPTVRPVRPARRRSGVPPAT